MKRGTYPAHSLHQGLTILVGGVVGAATSDPTAIPTTVLSNRDNFVDGSALTGARTGVGVLVLPMKDMPPIVLDVHPTIHNSSGTVLRANVRSWSISAKTITVDITTPSTGAATDLTTNDTLRVTVFGRSSTV